VQVTEADGTVQSFLVPYSLSAGKLKPGSYRYSLSTGNFRNAGNVTETPVLQAFLRYGLDGWPTPGVEWLTTTNYNNVGLQAAINQAWGTVAFNRLQSQGLGAVPSTGQSYAVNYVAPALGPVNVYAGISGQSLGYLSPITALTNSNADPYNPLSPKNNLFVSLGLNLGQWGAVSLGAVEQNTWTENTQTHQYRLSYSFYTRAMSLFFSMDQTTYPDGRKPLESMSVSASIPLGLGSVRGSVRASHNQSGSMAPTQALSFNGFHQDSQVGFNLNQSQTGDNSSTSASISRQHAYGNASASYSTSNTGREQSGLSASGGLVVHRGGVILAPTLGDTFAIVEVPKGEGAGVLGSQARINSRGYGVVPYLSAYYMNDVQITLEGASNELEVENASQKVAPVEGSIVRIKFSANSGRPLLIVLQPSSGTRVPIGATVSDAAGNEVGTVGQGSRALVRVQTTQDRLKVVWGDKPDETCWLAYALDEKQMANTTGFTHLKLRCEVAGGKEAIAQTALTEK
jgi:outer membrane usher protein